MSTIETCAGQFGITALEPMLRLFRQKHPRQKRVRLWQFMGSGMEESMLKMSQ
jgi:hypothetical protein